MKDTTNFPTRAIEAAWRNISATINIARVPGSHKTMTREPQVSALVDHFRPQLAKPGLRLRLGLVFERPSRG